MITKSVKTVGLLASLAVCMLAVASPANADKEFDKYAIESVSASLSSSQAGVSEFILTPGFGVTPLKNSRK